MRFMVGRAMSMKEPTRATQEDMNGTVMVRPAVVGEAEDKITPQPLLMITARSPPSGLGAVAPLQTAPVKSPMR